MIEKASRPVDHLTLVKWAFLLSREMPSVGGPSFYDFVPYHYGPFSFALFREADNLVRNGYLREIKVDGRDFWELVPDAPANTQSLSRDVRRDASRVVERFPDKPSDNLLDYVYKQFPQYTVNSKLRQLKQRCVAEIALYTIGYEGCSIDRLLDMLIRKGIQRVIDVRHNPVARRYGFHKSTLERLCGKVSIGYVHVPEVGIPSELRKDLGGPMAYVQLFERYEQELLPKAQKSVRRITRLMKEKASVLMCMEADPDMCHRTCVAKAVSSITHLPIHHL